jgi:hypothetical protein
MTVFEAAGSTGKDWDGRRTARSRMRADPVMYRKR